MSSDGVIWAYAQRQVSPAMKLLLVVMGDNAAPLDGEDGPLWVQHDSRWFMSRTNMTRTELADALALLQSMGYIEPYTRRYSTWTRGRKAETFEQVEEPGWILCSPEQRTTSGGGR